MRRGEQHTCTSPARAGRAAVRAFTLVDVLVSMSVIAVLIGLLIPTIGRVQETSRRVVCQSNVRQIGLGLILYADDFKGQLPATRYVPQSGRTRGSTEYAPQRTVTVRVSEDEQERGQTSWDGLGRLFELGYIPAPKVFYCPSHWGSNPYARYAPNWSTDGGEIVTNFHFRGEGPTRPGSAAAPYGATTTALYMIDPARSSLIADGMETRTDYNHRVGVNFFRADLTVHWFDDSYNDLISLLPESKEDADASSNVSQAWRLFDLSANQDN